ncbi:hypothetical protein KKA13_04690, partial [Patescibacteria group bacterium]|nr:hypothetical protein [Patescibacteria group bacterium]
HNAAAEILLAPEERTFTQKMNLELIKLALRIKEHGGDYADELKEIQDNWLWINGGYRGTVMDYTFFENTFKGLVAKEKADLLVQSYELQNWEEIAVRKKNEIYEKLNIDEKHRNLIHVLSVLSTHKVYRKDISFLVIYMFYQILEQFNDGLKQKHLYYLTLDEAKDMIRGELATTKQELAERGLECVRFGQSGEIFVGKKAREMVKKYVEPDKTFTEDDRHRVKLLEGSTACLGKTGDWVSGEVKIVISPEDMKKMRQGDILVATSTTPELVPAMKMAGAIVTDLGGITSHAAIVSRELNVPCVIGTRYASKLFKDGDQAVVCPRHGYIKFQK